MHFIFDIGGTHTRMATSEDGQTFGEPKTIDTPEDFKDGMESFAFASKEVIGERTITAVAGGITGVLNRRKDEFLRSPHLPMWAEKPVKSEIEKILGIEVHLENDTAMVGMGEAHSGAGRGYDVVAYITVSTGVGGVRIVSGRIDTNIYGFEPGHQIIDADGSILKGSLPFEGGFEEGHGVGHLESMVSGSAIERRFGKDPREIEDGKVWEEMAKYLAIGLNNTIVHWSPDVVVLGGGMMRSPGIDIEEVKTYLDKVCKIFPVKPDIKKADLGDFGGLHGSLAYLRLYKSSN